MIQTQENDKKIHFGSNLDLIWDGQTGKSDFAYPMLFEGLLDRFLQFHWNLGHFQFLDRQPKRIDLKQQFTIENSTRVQC